MNGPVFGEQTTDWNTNPNEGARSLYSGMTAKAEEVAKASEREKWAAEHPEEHALAEEARLRTEAAAKESADKLWAKRY
jgi:hypothetical protein